MRVLAAVAMLARAAGCTSENPSGGGDMASGGDVKAALAGHIKGQATLNGKFGR